MADSITVTETTYQITVTEGDTQTVTVSPTESSITITQPADTTTSVTTPASQIVTITQSASIIGPYYTDADARNAVSAAGTGLSYNNLTGVFTWLQPVVPIDKGGTGATTASAARTALGTNDAANLTTGDLAAARVSTIPINSFSDVSITKTADNIVYTDGSNIRARAASNWSLTDFTNDLTSGDLPAHTHAATDVTSGTFADARISESSVTQHEAALSIAASQLTSGSLSIDLNPSADLTYNIGTEDFRWLDIHGDLDGAVTFRAKNASGVTLTVGDIVYINGVSGSTPTVGLADCSDPAKMPAFGMVRDASVNPNAETHIATLGSVEGVDVPSGTYTLGSNVYVGTAGTFTDSPPTGEGNLIQNIGWVARVNPGGGPAGIIKVGGAGRTNAVPNLNEDRIFLGNASNQAASTALSSINLSKFNNDLVLADDNYKITPKSGTVKLFDDMQSLYPLFGTQSGYWTQLAGIYNDHHGVVRGYTANQSWRRANIDVESMIGRTVGEEALCEVYFDPDLRSNGAEISFGCWFGDGTEGLQSTISGSGWGDICHVGLTCYGNPALPYWRRFHRDNEGTYQNSSESDLLSFAFTNNQWVRLGLHCKRAELLGIEYWEVTAYIDGTQAFTQNIYTDTGCPGFTIMLYNNADAVTSYYHVDWINYEYSGRGTTVTHLNLEDL